MVRPEPPPFFESFFWVNFFLDPCFLCPPGPPPGESRPPPGLKQKPARDPDDPLTRSRGPFSIKKIDGDSAWFD